MHELILHHYPNSPFAEKARLMLGHKGLAWRSVMIPALMPKPDVVALTGGYRRTPFLQVGADIYCDTALIARYLEQREPQPPLFPPSQPLAPMMAQWADSQLFWCAVAWAMQPAGAPAILKGFDAETLKAFAADRAAMTAGMRRLTLADASVQLQSHLAALEDQLRRQADGHHLLGEAVSIADFAVAHSLWFIRLAEPVAGVLQPHARLGAWLDRMLAIGHGPEVRPMHSAEAIAVSAAATDRAAVTVADGLGFVLGQPVQVCATDYASDPVEGRLVGLDAHEVVVARSDVRAGAVQVHFPRVGFQVRALKA